MDNMGLRQFIEKGLSLEAMLTDFRRDLHMHPELSFQEATTADQVASRLEALGLAVRTGIGGHGIVADLIGELPGPTTIALRADMDALPIQEESGLPYASRVPGVMHACGHDAHTAILVGAAQLLNARKRELAGRVRFLFQSAEEINAGAKAMIADGALEGVDEIFGLHNLPTLASGITAIRFGPLMGSVDRMEITITGKGGHGAAPDRSIDPIVAASSIVMALQTAVSREISPFDPAVVTIGSFLAGQANNVIPQRAELTGTIRAFTPRVQAEMRERIERLAGQIAAAYRCECQVNYIEQVPVLAGHDDSVAHVERTAKALLGEHRCITAEPTLAGEDFSVYLQQVPGCFFWLGSGPETGAENAFGLHHPRFSIDESCLPVGASLLAAIAYTRLAPR